MLIRTFGTIGLATGLATGLLLAALAVHAQPIEFEAHYQTRISGVTAEGVRSLSRRADGSWQLQSRAQALWIKLGESSLVEVNEGRVRPLRYRFDHPLRERRSMDWRLDWNQGSAEERLHGARLPLQQAVYDPLSLQLQLQLDVCGTSEFSSADYTLLDRSDTKTYRIRRLREEVITTPAGKFDTIVLEQRREGRSKYSLLWLAPEWECLLVRMEQHDPDDDDHQQLLLQSATVGGKALRGR